MSFLKKNKDTCRDMQIPKSEKKITGPPLPNPGDASATQHSKIMTIISTYSEQMPILPYEQAQQLITAS